MRKIILFLGLILIGFFSYSQGLQNLTIEKYYISDVNDERITITKSNPLPKNSYTYRIYVDMKPNYKFQVVYGVAGHELRIATSTSFYNSEYGAITADDIIVSNNRKYACMLDTWISVGAGVSGKVAVLKTADTDGSIGNINSILQNNDSEAGIPIDSADGFVAGFNKSVIKVGIDSIIGIFEKGSNNNNLFSTFNGGWSSPYGSEGLDTSNVVCIGQFTTNGNFEFKFNIQIISPTGKVEKYVSENPANDEIQRNYLKGVFHLRFVE